MVLLVLGLQLLLVDQLVHWVPWHHEVHLHPRVQFERVKPLSIKLSIWSIETLWVVRSAA